MIHGQKNIKLGLVRIEYGSQKTQLYFVTYKVSVYIRVQTSQPTTCFGHGGRDLVHPDFNDYIALLYSSSDHCMQPEDGLNR